MTKWRVEVSWECEVEADNEGDALMQADQAFSMMSDARAEEIGPDEDQDGNADGTCCDAAKTDGWI